MNRILLSFDIEEFDMPFEYGKQLPLSQQIECSRLGTAAILDLLAEQNVKATFFSTVVYAQHAQDQIARIINSGHELASHSYYHSRFAVEDLHASRLELEKISGTPVVGFRMPRMQPVSNELLYTAGYEYNSSLNPTYLPGRYNNFFQPRLVHRKNNLFIVPASVTPILRMPLFWLAFHNCPLSIYQAACAITLKTDGYLNLYFHPWEFIDLTNAAYGLPSYVSRNSGRQMINRFRALLTWLKNRDAAFSRISEFVREYKN
ncbi:MAG TPA: polysaccharide deacetylase family protein [Chryseosolibacter sp.]